MESNTKQKGNNMKMEWKVGAELPVGDCIDLDNISSLIYSDGVSIYEFPDGKFVFFDLDRQEFYLLTLTINQLEISCDD